MKNIDLYKQASGEIWGFFKPRLESGDHTDAWWEKSIEDADGIVKNYKDTIAERYVIEYVVACLNELSRQDREPEKQKHTITYIADLLFKLVRNYAEENADSKKQVKDIVAELVEKRL